MFMSTSIHVIYAGISIVAISFFIIYYNILLPNGLKGFLFFIQVTISGVIYFCVCIVF